MVKNNWLDLNCVTVTPPHHLVIPFMTNEEILSTYHN